MMRHLLLRNRAQIDIIQLLNFISHIPQKILGANYDQIYCDNFISAYESI